MKEYTNVGYVARDENGDLYMYDDLPVRDSYHGEGTWNGRVIYELDDLPEDPFPELTWEDEPVMIELKLTPVQ